MSSPSRPTKRVSDTSHPPAPRRPAPTPTLSSTPLRITSTSSSAPSSRSSSPAPLPRLPLSSSSSTSFALSSSLRPSPISVSFTSSSPPSSPSPISPSFTLSSQQWEGFADEVEDWSNDPKLIKRVTVPGWFERPPLPILRSSVKKDILLLLAHHLQSLNPAWEDALREAVDDTELVTVLLSAVDTMGQHENRLHFAQLWFLVAALSVITNVSSAGAALESRAAIVFATAKRKTKLDQRYSRQGILFTTLLLHQPQTVKRFMRSGQLSFAAVYNIDRGVTWATKKRQQEYTGLRIAKIVDTCLDCIDGGRTVSTHLISSRIVPFLAKGRTEEEKRRDRIDDEAISGEYKRDADPASDREWELWFYRAAQERREDEAVAKQRAEERANKRAEEQKREDEVRAIGTEDEEVSASSSLPAESSSSPVDTSPLPPTAEVTAPALPVEPLLSVSSTLPVEPPPDIVAPPSAEGKDEVEVMDEGKDVVEAGGEDEDDEPPPPLSVGVALGKAQRVIRSVVRPGEASEADIEEAERAGWEGPPSSSRATVETFEVERIVRSRMTEDGVEYRVRWAGCGEGDDEWVLWRNMRPGSSMVHDYWFNGMMRAIEQRVDLENSVKEWKRRATEAEVDNGQYESNLQMMRSDIQRLKERLAKTMTTAEAEQHGLLRPSC